jgi:crossover junction endodeoxyribonuclease RuvC
LRILGVDPGSLATGWGVIEGTASRPVLVECGVLRARRSADPLATRLAGLKRDLEELLPRLRPTVAAVETPFHGASARSALFLAHARGVILAVLADARVEVAEYSPAAVKKAVTGNGRADKDQVAAMVGRLLGEAVGERSRDLSDALAVALCHQACSRYGDAVGRAGTRKS